MTNITLVGLGLMGTSLAGALKKIGGYYVTGVDTNPQAVKNAISMGYIDKGMGSFDNRGQIDILFLCMYPEEILKFIKKHKDEISPKTIVTDICGIQARLSQKIEFETKDLCRIGGHPICGAAGRGHEKAKPDFFSGASYILIDTLAERKEAMEALKNVLKKSGIGNIIVMSPREHDRKLAVVSHLPHLISSAFLTAFDECDFEIYGGSFRDLVRIADINPELWTQIVKNNKMYVTEVLDDFMNNLRGLKKSIESDDYESVYALFEKTNIMKRGLANNENI